MWTNKTKSVPKWNSVCTPTIASSSKEICGEEKFGAGEDVASGWGLLVGVGALLGDVEGCRVISGDVGALVGTDVGAGCVWLRVGSGVTEAFVGALVVGALVGALVDGALVGVLVVGAFVGEVVTTEVASAPKLTIPLNIVMYEGVLEKHGKRSTSRCEIW